MRRECPRAPCIIAFGEVEHFYDWFCISKSRGALFVNHQNRVYKGTQAMTESYVGSNQGKKCISLLIIRALTTNLGLGL